MAAMLRFRPTVASLVLTLAILLRLAGAVLNYESNDNHMEVVRIIAHEQRLPLDGEAWEAFQPKLYHVTVAALHALLPPMSERREILVAQVVNCIAGILTLLVLRAFLRDLPLSERARQISFALVALNPKMIATSIQATNDAFVILFAAVAITAAYRFFRSFARRDFIVMTAGVVLAGISKGTGLPLALAVCCTFAAALLKPVIARTRIAAYAAIFVVAATALILPLGSYWSRYQSGHGMFDINMQLYDLPENEVLNRPGILSIPSGFLTFRLIDMLKHPVVSNDQDNYPKHRTSMWSFAYGSAHSMHYDYYPWTWQSDDPEVYWVLRAIWILALLPTLILIIGSVRGVATSALAALRKVASADWNAELLLAITAAGYIAFLIVFCYRYRDFGTMKPIYVYPAMAPFVVYFARAFCRLQAGRHALLSKAAYAGAALLCAAYVADTGILLYDLLALRLPDA